MRLVDRWRALDPSWKFAMVTYLIARIGLSAWAFLVVSLFPVLVQNLDLFGEPVLAYFDSSSGERYAYSRQVDGAVLTFRAGEPGMAADAQTASVWSLREGRAVSGNFAGHQLAESRYPVEDIFPYRGVALEQNPWLSVWQRFDTNWYLKIAQRGFSVDDGSTVYFPLYPALVRVVGLVVADAMLAALIVSNLALIGALFWLYRLGAELFGATVAQRAVVYLLIFPTGFFLLTGYTESLFLLLTLGAFVSARRSQWFVAAIFGALAALTRLQGVLLVIPFAYMLWQQSRNTQHATRITSQVSRGVWLLLIPLATAAFLTFANVSLLASYESELHARFVLPWENLAASVALLARGQASFVDALNLLATLGCAAMVCVVWRKAPREYGLYALAMFCAPLFRMTTTQPLVSVTRYALALFPIFLMWGAWGRHAWVNRIILYLAFPLQLYLSAQFVLWGWVA